MRDWDEGPAAPETNWGLILLIADLIAIVLIILIG